VGTASGLALSPSFGSAASSSILDRLSVSSSAAYSLRKLRNAYTGNAIRVRRSSDNAEADIGFTTSGDLDTVALLAHCGAGSGFVTTWYDQSGNGRNATQTTAESQPRIVSNGVLETLNGKPAIRYDGVNDNLQATVPSLANQNNISFVGVTQILTRKYAILLGSGGNAGTSGIRWGIFGQGNLTSDGIGWAGSASELALGNGSLLPINTPYQAVYTKTPTQWQILLNGSTISTVNDTSFPTSTYSLTIGAEKEGSYIANALASEIIIISGALSTTDRQILERNQGQYYGITVA
jgi:hypothetical protein